MPTLEGAKKLALAGTLCFCSHGPMRGEDQAQLNTPPQPVALTVEEGFPLRLILTKKLPLNRENQLVTAKLVEPIYSFDREVAPPGAEVTGRVVKLRGVPRRVRFLAILGGDFTPLREPQIEFDTLVLKDGNKIPLRTLAFPGSDTLVRLDSGHKGGKKSLAGKATATARDQIETRKREVIEAVKAPGKLQRLETAALNRLPYHPQSIPAGARFNAELLAPLDFGAASIPAAELEQLGSQPASDSVVEARLTTSLNSGEARKGAPVEAVLTHPLFSSDHHLLYPVGSQLHGTVMQARAARRWHRNGQLRFMFQEIQLPAGVEPPVAVEAKAPRAEPSKLEPQKLEPRKLEARLESVEVDHKEAVKIDEEGGTKVAASKTRFIGPAVATMMASMGLDHDPVKSHGVPTGGYSSNAGGRAVAGGVGFGLIGTALGQISRPFAVSLGFYGAGWSVYTNLIAPGQEVSFPKDTRIEIRFGTRTGQPPK
jgi:hypothetical protein